MNRRNQYGSESKTLCGDAAAPSPGSRSFLEVIKNRYRAATEIRRGICLLHVECFAEAEQSFSQAWELQCGADRTAAALNRSVFGPTSENGELGSYRAASLLGQDRFDEAARQFAQISSDPGLAAARIREALALRAAGKSAEALSVLRHAVAQAPDDAELHFQLGTLLAGEGAAQPGSDMLEEAELRFGQALNLNPDHDEALVSLALCCGVRGTPAVALKHLQAAQRRNPLDGRIGLFLAQAARAVQQRGQVVKIQAAMPDAAASTQGIQELSRLIEAEPDFVDAFLSIPADEVDNGLFALLLRILEAALERQPEQAELYFHCGRVLDRMGRPDAAISANEKALGLNPKFTRALIELGRLYHQSRRHVDATSTLEKAVAAGAEYADVYYLLGNLHREQGKIGQARSAYRRALTINERYEAAQKALAELPA